MIHWMKDAVHRHFLLEVRFRSNDIVLHYMLIPESRRSRAERAQENHNFVACHPRIQINTDSLRLFCIPGKKIILNYFGHIYLRLAAHNITYFCSSLVAFLLLIRLEHMCRLTIVNNRCVNTSAAIGMHGLEHEYWVRKGEKENTKTKYLCSSPRLLWNFLCNKIGREKKKVLTNFGVVRLFYCWFSARERKIDHFVVAENDRPIMPSYHRPTERKSIKLKEKETMPQTTRKPRYIPFPFRRFADETKFITLFERENVGFSEREKGKDGSMYLTQRNDWLLWSLQFIFIAQN